MQHRAEVKVTLLSDWPRVKLLIHTTEGVRSESAMYDIATTAFEPYIRDAVAKAIRNLITISKPTQ